MQLPWMTLGGGMGRAIVETLWPPKSGEESLIPHSLNARKSKMKMLV